MRSLVLALVVVLGACASAPTRAAVAPPAPPCTTAGVVAAPPQERHDLANDPAAAAPVPVQSGLELAPGARGPARAEVRCR